MQVRNALAACVLGALVLGACQQTVPVAPVAVPRVDDRSAYKPELYHKPVPAEVTGQGGQPMPGQPGQPIPGQPGQPMQPGQPGTGGVIQPSHMLPHEPAFIEAYSKRRNPRMMVFVNRTLHGDTLPKEGLQEVMRTEEKHSATGAVSVVSEKGTNENKNAASAGMGSSSTEVSNKGTTDKSSFTSGGPADYTKSTVVRVAPGKTDEIGATPEDYELIEMSVVKYFDNSGKVQIRDSEAARAKLDREKILRIENNDPAAVRLLATELQTDVLIRITAKPTVHSSWGRAVRLMAKAVGTTDARNLGTAFVDMPLPITKTNVNIYTKYLADQLMMEMAKKWLNPPEYDPIEVRIYKTATVDDALKIRKFMQGIKGVQGVQTRGATGGSTTSYAALSVAYAGAPEDLYSDLKDLLGRSQGLKATDLSNNTISLEVTGPMELVTTTMKTETKTTTTVETTTTEEKKVDPIRPAPAE